MKKPNVETMLPKEAKEAMKKYYFDLIVLSACETDLNFYNEIKDNIFKDNNFKECGPWVAEAAFQCFEMARDMFETEYPLQWSNKHQRAFRKGHGTFFFSFMIDQEKRDAIIEDEAFSNKGFAQHGTDS